MKPANKAPDASAETLVEANTFVIEDPIAITYSSTSISGQPLFSYRDVERDLEFQGDDISRSQNALGEIVTVVLRHAVDAFTRTLTLVVPLVRVPMGESVAFATVAIDCVDTSQAFVGPSARAGVKHSYRIHELRGQASSVAS